MSRASVTVLSAPARAAQSAPAAVLRRLADAVPIIQSRAAELDREPVFPAEDMDLLRQIGALEVFGSSAPKPLELMQALRLVGRANLSLGRLFEGHVNGARLVEWYGEDAQRRRLARDLVDGAVFGVWNTEPAPGVRIVRGASGEVLAGAKSYASGAGAIQRAIVTAIDPSGARRMVLVDGDDPLRADPAAWRVRGMKATLSGLYHLDGLPVDAETLVGGADDYQREPRFSAGAWRFTAVQLGGVERILGLIRNHLVAAPDHGGMVHRARFASAVAATRTAWLWVREAAMRAEAEEAGSDEVALVLMTRGVLERAGLEVMEAAARLVGTRAFFTDHPIDLACRDLALYLRQPAPDQAADRAAQSLLLKDAWREDPLW